MKSIRKNIDEAFRKSSDMTAMFVALGKRHGGRGLERSANKPNGQSRHDNGEVRNQNDRAADMSGKLRQLVKTLGQNPSYSNIAVVARRMPDHIAIHVLVVAPGNVDKGQWVSFASSTEKEWLAIAKGPKPERYPHLKMPMPIAMVAEIDTDGEIGVPVKGVPETGQWVDAPIDFTSLPGAPKNLLVVETIARNSTNEQLDDIENKAVRDPFWTDLGRAIGMEPPGLQDIRRLGVDNGYRDQRGNVIN